MILPRICLTTYILFFFLLFLPGLHAQTTLSKDSLAVNLADTAMITPKTDRELNPKRSLMYSLILPGAGQFYNGRIWKVPMVYAALGTSVYFIIYNRDLYIKYRDGYALMVKKEITSFEGITRKEGVKQYRDAYRKYMETSYFITGALYLLNGVEAYVDAHLKGFTIDEDLSLHLKIFNPGSTGQLSAGIAIVFR